MRTTWLQWMRVLMIAVPALATAVSVRTDKLAAYVALVLIALLAARTVERLASWRLPALAAELIGFGWFMHYYGEGILYLLPFSTLIAVFAERPGGKEAVGWTLSGLVVLLAATQDAASAQPLPIALLWVAWAGVLYAAGQQDARRDRVEHLYDELAASHEQLKLARLRMQEYAAQIEEYAQAEERSRIASDIHDDLGHRLVRVKMMSEAALQLFEPNPERARGLLEQIRDQLQDGMERMRRTVRRLAPPDADDARRYSLDRLVLEAGAAMGIEVQFGILGMPQPLYPSADWILYQNAREAITNAVRHGGAAVVHVTLQYRPDAVAMTVASDGRPPGGTIVPGLGLRGMMERARLAGGKIEYGVGADGAFAVTTVLLPPKPYTTGAAGAAGTAMTKR